MKAVRCLFVIGCMLNALSLCAGVNPNVILQPNIRSVRFHVYGDQETLPVYRLGSSDRLELHFDDLDANVKSYYYTYQLCDYNWEPVNMSSFDFIKGFTQQRLTTYRFSSIAYTRYTHYQATLPDQNSVPSRSGNYLLKVFLDGDTTRTVFTRALLVLESKSAVSAQVIQPFSPQHYNTHQRIRFSVSLQGINSFDANRQVKVVVMQNFRWDNAQGGGVMPTYIRGNVLEYNTENNFIFPGGKEWRWLDLRSLRLLSDRIDRAVDKKTSVDIYVKPDIDRSGQRYVYYRDLNGLYQATTYETINPYWQGDYATVHFSFATPDRQPYKDKDLYLVGQLNDYQYSEANRMVFNEEKGLYEGSQYLKQGYYDYIYQLADRNNPDERSALEGNYWETENIYTVLVYYRSFTDRSDQLIGVARVSSRLDRPGISF